VTAAVPVLELRGERTRVGTLLKDLWAHRDLVSMLARQDYRSRYRSASLGLLWAVLLPLVQGAVIAIVFGRLIGGGKAHLYIPYVLTGVTAYSYISTSLGASTIFTIVVSLLLGASPGWWLLLAPASGCLSWALVTTLGALLSLLHVYSRDVRYIVQATLLVLFYATPIIYFLKGDGGVRALPESLRPYVLANPVTGVLQLNRLAITGHAAYVWTAALVTVGWVVALMVANTLAYARYERVACDRL
jgi:ABC-type polysaccharide/polyol phosphate export permease